jgi:N-ethylmaleimide reductase
MKKLFSPFQLGKMSLQNRVVMAPMTRSRAEGYTPNDLMREYYGARATAGLIITEGTSPSPNGLGYARIPGLFSADQINGWRKVTSAVHNQGGHIFVQLMHTGRASHRYNMPSGTEILAPSAIALTGQMWTDQHGMQPYPTPKEMSLTDIKAAIQEFADSAAAAVSAGFDGVELHAANGYLLEQFLNPNPNRRTDSYGGSAENRQRFVLDVAKAVTERIGGDRVGVRVSPYGVFNDTGAFDGITEFYADLSKKLSALGLVYIHVVDHSSMGAPPVPNDIKQAIRDNFKGAYILSGGYTTAEKAEVDLSENKGDLVAYGRPFIANPDLVMKLKNKTPFQEADQKTFYTPGPAGYTTYK